MVFQPGRTKTGGRKPGTPNKITLEAKEAFQRAFDENGGYERLVEWIKENRDNERVFYALYSKLFPLKVIGETKSEVVVRWKKDKEVE